MKALRGCFVVSESLQNSATLPASDLIESKSTPTDSTHTSIDTVRNCHFNPLWLVVKHSSRTDLPLHIRLRSALAKLQKLYFLFVFMIPQWIWGSWLGMETVGKKR